MRICKKGLNYQTCPKNQRNKLGCKRCSDSEEREITPYKDYGDTEDDDDVSVTESV